MSNLTSIKTLLGGNLKKGENFQIKKYQIQLKGRKFRGNLISSMILLNFAKFSSLKVVRYINYLF